LNIFVTIHHFAEP